MDTQNITQLEDNLDYRLVNGQPTQIIDAYIQLGQAHLKVGDTPKGLTQIEAALKICNEGDYPEILARLLGLKGLALKQIGNYAQASKSFRKSLQISEQVENTVLQSDALLQIGNLLAEQGKNLEAISKLDNALVLAIQNSDNPRKLFTANLLGNIFFSIESYEKAIENYALVLVTAQVLGDKNVEAASLIHIGRTFMMDGGYDGAIEHFELALDLSSTLGSAAIEIQALRGLMQTYQRLNKSSLAVVYGEQILNRVKGISDPLLELETLQDLCAILSADGRYDKTIPYLERSIDLAIELSDQEMKMKVLSDLGIAHYYLENYETSSSNLQAALEIAIQFQNIPKEASILGRLSALKADQGELDASTTFATRAIDLAQELEMDKLRGEQLVIMALNNYELGNRELAIEHCQLAIKVFLDFGESELATQAQEYLDEF
jgi:tetratricopeptide (TPR) repeat protein